MFAFLGFDPIHWVILGIIGFIFIGGAIAVLLALLRIGRKGEGE